MDQDEEEYECIAVLSGHSQDVKLVKFHPSNELLASCSYDNSIKIWEEDDYDWICKQTLEAHTSTVWSISFSHDGNMLYSCSTDKTVIIWKLDEDGSKYKQISTLTGYHDRDIYSIDVNKDDMIVTGCGDDTVRVFEKVIAFCYKLGNLTKFIYSV